MSSTFKCFCSQGCGSFTWKKQCFCHLCFQSCLYVSSLSTFTVFWIAVLKMWTRLNFKLSNFQLLVLSVRSDIIYNVGNTVWVNKPCDLTGRLLLVSTPKHSTLVSFNYLHHLWLSSLWRLQIRHCHACHFGRKLTIISLYSFWLSGPDSVTMTCNSNHGHYARKSAWNLPLSWW